MKFFKHLRDKLDTIQCGVVGIMPFGFDSYCHYLYTSTARLFGFISHCIVKSENILINFNLRNNL